MIKVTVYHCGTFIGEMRAKLNSIEETVNELKLGQKEGQKDREELRREIDDKIKEKLDEHVMAYHHNK